MFKKGVDLFEDVYIFFVTFSILSGDRGQVIDSLVRFPIRATLSICMINIKSNLDWIDNENENDDHICYEASMSNYNGFIIYKIMVYWFEGYLV